jgi:hypothetical protein
MSPKERDNETAEPPLAAGKSPSFRIRALKRRIVTGSQQARIHFNVAESYARGVEEDMAEVRRLEEHNCADWRGSTNDER